MPDPGTSDRHRRRRLRALLAGGVVLGVGAVGTLAAWSDSEFATGTFNAGQFNIQGSASQSASPDPSSWGDHNTSATALALSLDTGTAPVQPGKTVYAPLNIRVDPTKNAFDASVVVTSGSPSGNSTMSAKMTWGAKIVPDASYCKPTLYDSNGTQLVPAGQSMSYTGPSTAFTVGKSAAKVTVCFATTMQDMGTTDDPNNWNFGTSPLVETWRLDANSV